MDNGKPPLPADLALAIQDEVAHINELLKELRLIRLQDPGLLFLEEKVKRHAALQHKNQKEADKSAPGMGAQSTHRFDWPNTV